MLNECWSESGTQFIRVLFSLATFVVNLSQVIRPQDVQYRKNRVQNYFFTSRYNASKSFQRACFAMLQETLRRPQNMRKICQEAVVSESLQLYWKETATQVVFCYFCENFEVFIRVIEARYPDKVTTYLSLPC